MLWRLLLCDIVVIEVSANLDGRHVCVCLQSLPLVDAVYRLQRCICGTSNPCVHFLYFQHCTSGWLQGPEAYCTVLLRKKKLTFLGR